MTTTPANKKRTSVDIPKLEYWTPADAAEYRKRPHPGQRKVTPSAVRLYRTYIEIGRWYPRVSTPFAIMQDGTLGNGNNRSEAIASLPADHPAVPVLVVRNVTEDELLQMDSGKNRTLAHHLGYTGHQSHQSEIAAITSVVMATQGPPLLPRPDKKPDTADAIKFADEHRQRLLDCAMLAKSVSGRASLRWGLGNIATTRALGWLLFFTIDHPDVHKFWSDYAAGNGLTSDDPRMALITYYLRAENLIPKGSQSRTIMIQRMADLSACWNAYVNQLPFVPWDSKAEHFVHPSIDHSKLKGRAA